MRWGRPALVSIVKLPSLNDRVLQITEKVVTLQGLTNDIGNLCKKKMEERGGNVIGKDLIISNSVLKKYTTSELSILPGVELGCRVQEGK